MKYINHKTWLKDRNKGIGASDIAILCGESEFMTPLDLWEQKTGIGEERQIEEDLQKLFDAGHDQEAITINRFLKNQKYKNHLKIYEAHINKKNLPKNNNVQLWTEYTHPTHDFLYCHPDMIYNKINVESKFIKYKGNEWDFDDLTANGIPFKYYLQVQFQMMCTGLSKTILCANYQGVDFYEFEIEANPEIFLKFEKICFDFWQLVKTKQPPMATNRADVRKLFPDRNFKSLSLTGEIEIDTVMQKDRYSFLKDRAKKIKKEQEIIKTSVMSLMVNNNILQTANGEQIAKISVSESEKLLAFSKIKKDHPKVYKYLKNNDMIKTVETERFLF